MIRHKPEEASVLPYDEREDELLMAQYVAGDDAAFRELYRRYKSRAYGYFSKRISDRAALDELFQQAFLRLHHSRENYDETRLFSAWFFTICRNLMVDYFRAKGSNLETIPLTDQHPSPQIDEIAPFTLPKELMASLSIKQQEAIRLRYEQELDFNEIARQLSTTEQNVRQLISRGIRKLKNLVRSSDE